MRDRITAVMKEAKDDEDTRIALAVEEQDHKIALQLDEKMKKAKQEMVAINDHRNQEVTTKRHRDLLKHLFCH